MYPSWPVNVFHSPIIILYPEIILLTVLKMIYVLIAT